MPKQTLIVEKVPRQSPSPKRPIAFPRMPQLYLELIENKDKIKQNLINKHYSPRPQESPKQSPVEIDSDKEEEVEIQPRRRSESEEDIVRHTKDEVDTILDHMTSPTRVVKSLRVNITPPQQKIENFSPRERPSSRDDRDYHHRDREDFRDYHRDREETRETRDERPSSRDYSRYREHRDERPPSRDYNHDREYERYKVVDSPRDNRDFKESVTIKDETETDRKEKPPSLSELENKGRFVNKKEAKNIENISLSELDEEEQKKEYLFKFHILKKSYSSATNIPDFTMHSDLNTMKRSYDDTVRKLTLDSNVQNYKMYLLGFFAVVEYFGGGVLGFDMQGLTEFQLSNMNSYDKLLVELGEKIRPEKSRFPVEVRLVGVALLNILFFVVSKMVMNKTGVNILTLFRGLNPQAPAGSKKKMKSPNIVFEEEKST